MAELLSNALYKEQGIFGFVTVDFLTFKDPKFPKQDLFWAIGLDCFLNAYTAGFFYFNFIARGDFNAKTNTYELQESLESEEISQRLFFYAPYLYHPGLSAIHYNTFFHMCRIHQIFFDVDKKTGATFLLIDQLQSGVLSLMGIGKESIELLETMHKALDFIVNISQK